MNNVFLVGRLGMDVELKEANNSTVCNFDVAVSKYYKDKDGKMVEQTDWIPVVAWNLKPEFVSEKLLKGKTVIISGENKTSMIEIEGKKYKTMKVVVNQIKIP
jgi:single-strand DNA-binding protein